MGRFQLELIYSFTFIFYLRPVNCLSQEAEVTTPTRPVDNVVIATKGLQERKTQWDDVGKKGNENKLILTEPFPSVHET